MTNKAATKIGLMVARRIIFIIGFGRSGTTFLAKLLDSHPDVLYRHEPDSVLVNTEIPFIPDESDLKRYRNHARSYVESLCNVNASKSAGHRPIFDKSYRTAFRQRSFRVAVYLAKAIENGIPLLNRWAKVPDLIEPVKRAEIVYVIKSVNSVGRARLFREGNPQSRFLHIVRHPCGVIASVLRGAEKGYMQKRAYLNSAFRMKEAAQYPYTFDDMEQRSFEEQYAFCWMVLNQKVQDEMQGDPFYRLVRYEDLCYRLEASMQDLFGFCDLKWNRQTKRFIARLESSQRTEHGYFDILRSPLSSVHNWRQALSEEQVERILGVVRHAPVGRQFLVDEGASMPYRPDCVVGNRERRH